jgi:hypothetical protein
MDNYDRISIIRPIIIVGLIVGVVAIGGMYKAHFLWLRWRYLRE